MDFMKKGCAKGAKKVWKVWCEVWKKSTHCCVEIGLEIIEFELVVKCFPVNAKHSSCLSLVVVA